MRVSLRIRRYCNQKRTLFIASLIVLMISVLRISSQSPLPTPIPVPTQVQASSYVMTFPNFLYCSRVDPSNVGLSWEGVIVGKSIPQDIFDVISRWTDTYETRAWSIGADIEYTLNIRNAIDQTGRYRSPTSLRFCTVDDKVSILSVNYPVGSQLYINDFVANYGLPDAVSYDYGSPSTRLVFWARHGIAARVFYANEDASSTSISTIIYFPPVVGDVTKKWPFSETITGQNDKITLGFYEEEVNPFDFDAMIATITAQPTRTLTPTFTPRTPVPLRTPTPTSAVQTNPPIR